MQIGKYIIGFFILEYLFNICAKTYLLKKSSKAIGKTVCETKHLYEVFLNNLELLCRYEGIPVIIRTFDYGFSINVLNANSLFPGLITVTPAWINKYFCTPISAIIAETKFELSISCQVIVYLQHSVAL